MLDQLIEEAMDRMISKIQPTIEDELRCLARDTIQAMQNFMIDMAEKEKAKPKKKQRRQKAKPTGRKQGKRKPGKLTGHIDKLIGLLSKTEGTKKFLMKKLGVEQHNFKLVLTAAKKDLKGKGLTIKSEGRKDECTYKMVKR
jgi:hypothetical protein